MSESTGAVRPANRRDLILEAATALFRDRGYGAVSLADVAAAVDVTPPALYRHVKDKQELLGLCLDRAVSDLVARVAQADSFDALAANVTDMIRQRRGLAPLWRRESVHLDAAVRRRQAERLRRVGTVIDELTAAERPDLPAEQASLLGTATLSLFTAIALHRPSFGVRAVNTWAGQLARAIADAPVDAAPDTVPTPTAIPDSLVPRRARILAAASELFADRGVDAVSIEEIGHRAGIAGPSVYKHFGGKLPIVDALAQRASDVFLGVVREAVESTDASSRLRVAIAAHAGVVLADPQLITFVGAYRDASWAGQPNAVYRDYRGFFIDLIAAAYPDRGRAVCVATADVLLFVLGDLARRRESRLSDLVVLGDALISPLSAGRR
ncbi:TetR family transcriptional regulator [Epidermidibacterium keratini]|uniref:TetR family transcriptional regulator n=1 Tax=Epidermidibacterium keratini TaxID=1891644 RepID=A0A7L4YMU7_9ACTN|nr:TetR/AcrR family transcriptional regulator [Epidermidibacterium keratini]QHC00611.1 TetR family transcriptional regulator [Epidermidibacterium keratini]